MTPIPPKMSGLQLLDIAYGLGACEPACDWIATHAHLTAEDLWAVCPESAWLHWLVDEARGWPRNPADEELTVAIHAAWQQSHRRTPSTATMRKNVTWPMVQSALEANHG